ncbi:MAG: trypsin-like peptidase domain-containing protein [Pirellulales bacterium]
MLASTETTTAYVRGRVFGAGTAFAVSREGILISNAHVFLDPNDQSLTGLRNDLELQALFAGPTAEMLLQELGGAPSEALREPVFYSIIDWTGRTMTAKGEFKSAELVLQYAAPKKALSSMIFAAPEPITVPLEILAKGEAAPGKDVAILRAIMQPDDREKLKAGGARDDEIDDLVAEAQNDKLICLTLGSAQDVLPGAKVQSLGFPGSAFLSDWMTEAAAYRVSARDGQVGQMKPVRGGYEMIEMTAGIDHGDSGGPLLDSDGRVIGINVGGGSNNATTLAVPIDVAREFLNKAGIEPDPGTLTIRWHEGLAAYQKGDFQRAWELFDLVRKNQGSDMALSAVPNRLELQAQQPFGARRTETLLTPNLVNPYVEAMQKRAAAKIK